MADTEVIPRALEIGSPPLGANDVHVWQLDLRRTADEVNRMTTLLDADERAQADQFRFEDGRRRFIVRRACRRAILAAYLQRSPEQSPGSLRFAIGKFGKPALRLNGADAGLHFSASHSDDVGLLATTCLGDIGVDIERIRLDIEPLAIAERIFDADETAALRAAARSQRHAIFFPLWARKEALLKAWGVGLSQPDAIQKNPPTTSEAIRLIHMHTGEPSAPTGDCQGPQTFAAAVAIRSENAPPWIAQWNVAPSQQIPGLTPGRG